MRRLIGICVAALVAVCSLGLAGHARASEPVPVVYFYTEGCSECQAVEKMLSSLEGQGNFVIYRKYEALDVKAAKVRSALDDAYAVQTESRGIAPTLFVGRKVLLRESAIRSGFADAVRTATPEDSKYLVDLVTKAEAASGAGGDKTAELFKTFSILTVVGAGLLDGINPCAFATLIFFISYLIMRSKSKRDILRVGLAFAAGVFAAYLAAGLGLYQLVSRATWFFALSKWFYLATGIFAAGIAVFSVRDAWRARHGDLGDMTLQLPERNKGMIHKLIRERSTTGLVAASAFLVAFPVSLFEFMCTGQTYLPTIVLIFSQNALRGRATLLLIIYNLLFVAPLVLITVVAYFGVTSERLVAWLKRNTTVVKVATAVLFVALASFLIVRALALFGVR